jgi:hypothetical protein
MNRPRITFDVSPELRRRIKAAALQNNLSISEYLVNILEKIVPDETQLTKQERHPVPPDIMEEVYRVQEQVLRDSKGHIFEDTTEALRQLREERTQYLEQLRKQK